MLEDISDLSGHKTPHGKVWQVIPAEAVEAVVETSALEAVETPCDVGRAWDVEHDGTEESVCPNGADWSALAHNCHLGQPILLCTKHLALCRQDHWPDQLTKWECERCGFVAVSRDELIWNVRRIA